MRCRSLRSDPHLKSSILRSAMGFMVEREPVVDIRQLILVPSAVCSLTVALRHITRWDTARRLEVAKPSQRERELTERPCSRHGPPQRPATEAYSVRLYPSDMAVHRITITELTHQPGPSGLAVPRDFYFVLRRPAPLAGMSYPPEDLNWSELGALGFQHLIRLEGSTKDPAPLRLTFDGQLEDLAHGRSPRDPEREEMLVHEAAGLAIECLERSEGVAVHCQGGTGRTGTIIGVCSSDSVNPQARSCPTLTT